MKVLVLGAAGMLGHRLLIGLAELGYDVVAGIRGRLVDDEAFQRLAVKAGVVQVEEGLDCRDLATLKSRIVDLRPDVILNCVGVIKQKDGVKFPSECIALNALLPHALHEIVSQWKGWLVHFSTDCVFDGRQGNYSEEDIPNAEDLYGRTKAIGEVVGDFALTLRTSIIGHEIKSNRSLFDWFLSQRGGEVWGWEKAIYSGLTTREMLRVVEGLLRRSERLCGLYNVASAPISKFDLLCLINERLSLDVTILRDGGTVSIDRSLSSRKFHSKTGYVAPDWRQMVDGLAKDLEYYR